MNKLIMDGKVAVLYTTNYGAGWSTWNRDHPECVFDPEVAKMIIFCHGSDAIEKYAEEKYGEEFVNTGAKYLNIKWLPEGTKFYIEEYDGFEKVVTEERLYLTA